MPRPPTNLTANPVTSSTQIDLEWVDNSADETAFRIERSVDGISWAEIVTVGADVITYQDTAPECHTEYHYRIRAFRSGDGAFSDYSNSALTRTSCPPPIAPTNLTATSLSQHAIRLDWIDNANSESGYLIERSLDGINWTLLSITLSADTITHQDGDLVCGTVYHYRVQAHRSLDGQQSAYSNVVNATTQACPAPVTNTVGLYRNGRWQFRDSNSTGVADIRFTFGPQAPGWTAIIGDWDGDGVDGIGVYKDGTWLLRNATINGSVDIAFRFGPANEQGWQPIVGDWNGDGTDTVGVYKDGRWLLRNSNTNGSPDTAFTFGAGQPTWLPIAGDWSGDSLDTVGLYKDGIWRLHNSLTSADRVPSFNFGPPQGGWSPLTGDWDRDGGDTIGLFRDGIWRLRNNNSATPDDIAFEFGDAGGWQPLASYRGGVAILAVLSIDPINPIPTSTLVPRSDRDTNGCSTTK